MPRRAPPPRRAPAEAPRRGVARAYRTDRLRVRHLRLLELVDRHGSLGAAARELGISQPAATLLLRELETVFAARLADRDARGARLTAAGRNALAQVAIALAAVGRALDAAGTPAAECPLRIGCVQVAGVSALPAALGRLERRGAMPPMQLVEGRARDLLGALCAGRLDGMIGWMDETLIGAFPVGDLDVAPLWRGRMQVVAARSHPLARLAAVGVADLARWPWVVPPPESLTHAAYRRVFLDHGIPVPPVAIECAALHTTLRLVSGTRLLAMAPDAAVRQYAKLGMVAALKGRELDAGRSEVSFVTRRDSAALPALTELRAALVAVGGRDGRSPPPSSRRRRA